MKRAWPYIAIAFISPVIINVWFPEIGDKTPGELLAKERYAAQDTLNVNLRSFHNGDRFRVVYRQHIFDTTRAWIEVDFLQVLRDKRTVAEFLWYESGGKAGFCQIIINEKEKER